MNLSSLIMGVIVFSSVITGMALFYADVSSTYGVANTTTDFSELNNTGAIASRVKEIDVKLRSIVENFTITSIFDLATLFVFQIGGLLLGFATVMVDLIFNVPDLFTSIPIPDWFTTMLAVIAVVFIVFQVIKLANRVDI